ncbi:hypothetical protein CYMTET_30017, partial [Cymbomonas tetramitiformis]
YLAGDWSKLDNFLGKEEYDVILTSDTIYSAASQDKLYAIIKHVSPSPRCPPCHIPTCAVLGAVFESRWLELITVSAKLKWPPLCLKRTGGVAYAAQKSHYFGVGGSTRQFEEVVQKDGAMSIEQEELFADGSSNVREILCLRHLTDAPP